MLQIFTQQRFKLNKQRSENSQKKKEYNFIYLLVFQIWMVSSSTLLCFSACSSRKSKKYLTAGGTTAPEHSTLRKKSSTNCCSVPWKGRQIMWDGGRDGEQSQQCQSPETKLFARNVSVNIQAFLSVLALSAPNLKANMTNTFPQRQKLRFGSQ